MKNKLWAVFLCALALCLLLCCGAALADSSGSCGKNVTYTLTDAGVLTISGTGMMTSYTSVSQVPWYYTYDTITSVVIEDGVKSIGDYAFCGCTGLTDVAISDSVINIGYSAFRDCTGLTGVNIPYSVTRIERVLKDAGDLRN